MDGVDVSDGAIATAKEKAAELSLPMRYFVADLNAPFPPELADQYDFVFAIAALHHIERLENILKTIHDRLSDDGIFMFYEYCGPTRFQWHPRTLRIANDILAMLPRELRRDRNEVKSPPYAEFIAI